MNKKLLISKIKKLKKLCKSNDRHLIVTSTQWDSNHKSYSLTEVAARYLRLKGYSIKFEITDNTNRPSYQFGILIFYRYCKIIIN